jgi:hypothetical protein
MLMLLGQYSLFAEVLGRQQQQQQQQQQQLRM